MANRLTGKIKNLTVTRDGTRFELDSPSDQAPREWIIALDHINYNALCSLALAAAANQWIIQARIAGDEEISPEKDASVAFLRVEW